MKRLMLAVVLMGVATSLGAQESASQGRTEQNSIPVGLIVEKSLYY